MAPPTRLRPHLNDLLQKNLELEHVVADLRHQLTQSSAKWADERKTLATGCDVLMASFAKFRARLDVQSSALVDSEGIEQNLDGEIRSEETGEVDDMNAILETEGDHASSVAGDLRERCDALSTELHVKELLLESFRRSREAAEEELQHVKRSLEVQSEQLQAALAFTKADTSEPLPPRASTDASTQVDPPKPELEDSVEKLGLASEEITRLKQLLQQWKRYGNDWKRDAQSARARTNELESREVELNAKAQAAEESQTLLETERMEVQKLTNALADQTAALDHQRTVCQESVKRIQDLEAMVSLLRAQLSPEQLASVDSGQNQTAPAPPNTTESQTARTDTDPNKPRSDMIVLKIPYRSVKIKTTGETTGPRDDQQSHALASSSASANSVPQTNKVPVKFNPSDFELCIHTCNPYPCRNESQSILWLRKQASLPRHTLSSKKHRDCTPACAGHRLLVMPVAEAMKEPRRAKCRPPTEADVARAATEANKTIPNRKTRAQRTEAEGKTQHDGSGESEDAEDSDEGSAQEDGFGEEASGRKPGKRARARLDAEERARKLRPRLFYSR